MDTTQFILTKKEWKGETEKNRDASADAVARLVFILGWWGVQIARNFLSENSNEWREKFEKCSVFRVRVQLFGSLVFSIFW